MSEPRYTLETAIEWAAQEIADYSKSWLENGPSKAAARAIINELRRRAAALQAQEPPKQ